MKIFVSLVSVLVSGLPLGAQVKFTLSQSNASGKTITIRNDATVALTAVAVSVRWKMDSRLSQALGDVAPNPAKIYFDSMMDESAHPLPPNQEQILDRKRLVSRGLPLSDPRIALEEPLVTAEIFADGSTTGDPSLLSLLLLPRSNMLLAVDTALETLSDAGKHNVPPGWLIGQFRRLSLSRFYLAPEQEVGREIYESILGRLINLPDQALGAPFPPTAFVDEETALLRQRRTTLVESRPNLEQAARNLR